MNSLEIINKRVLDLMNEMTLDEKIGQMLQMDGNLFDLEYLINDLKVGSLLHTQNDLANKAIDLASKTRLKIPLLIADDCIHGHGFQKGATVFPTQLAMAASWDEALLFQVAQITAKEATTSGLKWTFSPVLDLARDLRWGRLGETFGEDPLLCSRLGAAMVKGYQGDDQSSADSMMATAKHFAGYSETIGGQDASEADLSRRKLRSFFLPAFENAVKAGCMSVMTAYQAIDGVPCTINSWLLNDVLRQEWGFDGLVVTDYDNITRMCVEHNVFDNIVDASSRALCSGNDMIMATEAFCNSIKKALEKEIISESIIDKAVYRILFAKFKLGLFENPNRYDPQKQKMVLGCKKHKEVALESARNSLILLKNDGILPLKKKISKLALIGPNLDSLDAQLGDWAGASGQVSWMKDGQSRNCVVTIKDAFEQLSPSSVKLNIAKGAEIAKIDKDKYGYFNEGGKYNLGDSIKVGPDSLLINEAIEAALSSDAAIVVIGDVFVFAGESCSTATLELQGGQRALLEALSALDIPLILVLVNTKPLVLPKCVHNVSAIIEVFNPGSMGGVAVAEAVWGYINPCGKLPVSIPFHVGQQPVYYNRVRGQHGDDYADITFDPHFVFGHGLSYSNFIYSDLTIHTPSIKVSEELRCSIFVENDSQIDGYEIVQLYVKDLITSVTWAQKELKDFKKVFIKAGEKVKVEFAVPASAFFIVNETGSKVVEKGEFELIVGPDSGHSLGLKECFFIV